MPRPQQHQTNGVRLRSSIRKFPLPAISPIALLQVVLAFAMLLTLIQVMSTNVRAQSATATLSGTVIDENGALIPAVNVVVINIAQGFQRSTTTNESGIFIVPLLPPGTYVVKAEHEGFTQTEVRDLSLNVNDQVSIKIQLKVGSLKGQTVDVIDTPTLINESPAVSTVVDRQFVANLPMNGRSFQALINLTPGVVLTKATVVEPGQFSVNGQRADSNYFTIDGASANIDRAEPVRRWRTTGRKCDGRLQ